MKLYPIMLLILFSGSLCAMSTEAEVQREETDEYELYSKLEPDGSMFTSCSRNKQTGEIGCEKFLHVEQEMGTVPMKLPEIAPDHAKIIFNELKEAYLKQHVPGRLTKSAKKQ